MVWECVVLWFETGVFMVGFTDLHVGFWGFGIRIEGFGAWFGGFYMFFRRLRTRKRLLLSAMRRFQCRISLCFIVCSQEFICGFRCCRVSSGESVVGFTDLCVIYGVCMVQSIVIMVRNAEMVVDLAVCVVGSGGCECGMEGWGWFSGGFWVVFREFVIGNWGSVIGNGGF